MSAILDTRRALLDLLNVFAGDGAAELHRRAEHFLATYGALREIRDIPRMTGIEVAPFTARETVEHLAQAFSWAIVTQKQAQRLGVSSDVLTGLNLNLILQWIFENLVTIDGKDFPTALRVDVVAGTIEPRPRDLLDALAVELMRSRRKIARCSLCSKFFYREWNKDRYCSPVCGDEARRRGQAKWIADKRAKQEKMVQKQRNKKRRTTR